MIQDHSDHGVSKEQMKPCPEWIHSVRLMHHDPSDLRSLILIISKKRTLRFVYVE